LLINLFGVSVSKVRIFSASTSAFYHLKNPHIRILPVAHTFTKPLSTAYQLSSLEKNQPPSWYTRVRGKQVAIHTAGCDHIRMFFAYTHTARHVVNGTEMAM